MNNRKKWLIEPSFQISFMKFTASILISVTFIYYVAIFTFFQKFKNLGLNMGLDPQHIFFEFLDAQKTRMNLILIISFIITSVVFLLWGLFVSNRIAGPIYRLKKELEHFIETRAHRNITFRKEDYFPELAELVNRALKKKD